jgi:hypothetical protein
VGQGRALAPGLGVVPGRAADVPQPHVMVEARAVLRGPVVDAGADRCRLETIGLGDRPAAEDAAVAPAITAGLTSIGLWSTRVGSLFSSIDDARRKHEAGRLDYNTQ